MKKLIKTVLLCMLLLTLLVGCSQENSMKKPGEEKLRIVATIFPVYDWVRQIVGDAPAELTLLLDSGVDLHSYQPTVDDMVQISTCDVFIYVGGESDGWVEDALAGAVNRNMTVINLMDVLGDAVKEEEIVEGMEDDHEEHDEHEHEEHDDHDEHTEYDEHIWLSLKNAKAICASLSEKISVLDAAHAEQYRANTDAYLAKLDALDTRYQEAAASAERNTLLFGDRFPFRYLVDDYDLTYYAAFAGCSAETEASFDTVVFLANKADELGLDHILILEGSSDALAKTIISSTADKAADILTVDSMQSTTSADVAGGTSYLSIMESNLETLKAALN